MFRKMVNIIKIFWKYQVCYITTKQKFIFLKTVVFKYLNLLSYLRFWAVELMYWFYNDAHVFTSLELLLLDSWKMLTFSILRVVCLGKLDLVRKNPKCLEKSNYLQFDIIHCDTTAPVRTYLLGRYYSYSFLKFFCNK